MTPNNRSNAVTSAAKERAEMCFPSHSLEQLGELLMKPRTQQASTELHDNEKIY